LQTPPDWGALTGVRPAKLVRSLLHRGMTRGQVAEQFRDRYFVSSARTALAVRCAAYAEQALEGLGEDKVSLYLGIPFCPSRCAYCSFVSSSIEKSAGLIEPYVDALCADVQGTGALLREMGKKVTSIYIGGGTPTTLSADQLARLMDVTAKAMDFSALREYTVEAGRPDTITPEKLHAIRAGGADRVSINPQTMNDEVLARIGRRHSADDVVRAYEQARSAGFRVINMDTIAGLDGDTPESFADQAHRTRPGEHHRAYFGNQARRRPVRPSGQCRTARRSASDAGLCHGTPAACRIRPVLPLPPEVFGWWI